MIRPSRSLPAVCGGCVLGFLLAWVSQAKTAGFEARVTGGALCTQTAPSGKAWVTPLVQGQNAFLGRLTLAADAKVPEHQDATEEYLYIQHGRGVLRIDGRTFEIGPGDSVYMPAHARVSFENGREQLVAIQVFAGPGPAQKYTSWAGCTDEAPK